MRDVQAEATVVYLRALAERLGVQTGDHLPISEIMDVDWQIALCEMAADLVEEHARRDVEHG